MLSSPNRFRRLFPRLMREGTPLAASLASVGSAGVSVCTGGICTVAAQAGAGLSGVMAGTSSGLSGAMSFAGSQEGALPAWLQSTASATPALPGWLQVLILMLMGSTLLAVYGLAGKPKLALLAGVAGILCVVADLGWVPGGQTGRDAALGLGVPLLVLGPWLPRLRLPGNVRTIFAVSLIGGAMTASLATVYLQVGLGWHPCLDCWLERISLWSFTFLGFFWIRNALNAREALPPLRSTILFGLALSGYLVSFLQLLEIAHAKAVAALMPVCGAVGPSCAQAGGRLLLGYPIAWESLSLFGGLMPLLLLVAPASQRKTSASPSRW